MGTQKLTFHFNAANWFCNPIYIYIYILWLLTEFVVHPFFMHRHCPGPLWRLWPCIQLFLRMLCSFGCGQTLQPADTSTAGDAMGQAANHDEHAAPKDAPGYLAASQIKPPQTQGRRMPVKELKALCKSHGEYATCLETCALYVAWVNYIDLVSLCALFRYIHLVYFMITRALRLRRAPCVLHGLNI